MGFEYLERNTEEIRRRIRQAAEACGRKEEDILLLAAVKYATAEEIAYLHRELGICHVGENRVQQLLEHYEALPNRDRLKFHFIGTLQTNKVKYIVDKVCMIHSVDSVKLAEEIERRAAAKSIVMDILAEINSGEEESKSGLAPHEVAAFCRAIEGMSHLRLRGFMTMAPRCENKADYYGYFNKTYSLANDLWTNVLLREGKPLISMGMSESFEEAIACGSDIVRVGRSFFAQ